MARVGRRGSRLTRRRSQRSRVAHPHAPRGGGEAHHLVHQRPFRRPGQAQTAAVWSQCAVATQDEPHLDHPGLLFQGLWRHPPRRQHPRLCVMEAAGGAQSRPGQFGMCRYLARYCFAPYADRVNERRWPLSCWPSSLSRRHLPCSRTGPRPASWPPSRTCSPSTARSSVTAASSTSPPRTSSLETRCTSRRATSWLPMSASSKSPRMPSLTGRCLQESRGRCRPPSITPTTTI